MRGERVVSELLIFIQVGVRGRFPSHVITLVACNIAVIHLISLLSDVSPFIYFSYFHSYFWVIFVLGV